MIMIINCYSTEMSYFLDGQHEKELLDAPQTVLEKYSPR